MSHLFCVCPECHIEQPIRAQYGHDSLFLTKLGGFVDLDEFMHAEEVNELITKEKVESLYLVNDPNCTFIQSALNGGKGYNTKAEQTFRSLIEEYKAHLPADLPTSQKARKLAKWNVHRQTQQLLSAAFIGNKIRDGFIRVYGMIYDRSSAAFEQFEVKV